MVYLPKTLGKGGGGVVRAAQILNTKQWVAMKYLEPTLNKEAERQELNALGRLGYTHGGIEYNAPDLSSRVILSMELAKGKELKEYANAPEISTYQIMLLQLDEKDSIEHFIHNNSLIIGNLGIQPLLIKHGEDYVLYGLNDVGKRIITPLDKKKFDHLILPEKYSYELLNKDNEKNLEQGKIYLEVNPNNSREITYTLLTPTGVKLKQTTTVNSNSKLAQKDVLIEENLKTNKDDIFSLLNTVILDKARKLGYTAPVINEIVPLYAPGNVIYKEITDKKAHFTKKKNLELDQNPSTAFSKKIEITRMMLEEIQKIHDKGLIHRDIKLNNFMYDTESNELKPIDFGSVIEKVNATNSIEGTTTVYLAPEIIEESLFKQQKSPKNPVVHFSTQSDIYSLGLSIAQLFGVLKYQYGAELFQFAESIDELGNVTLKKECYKKGYTIEQEKFYQALNFNFQKPVQGQGKGHYYNLLAVEDFDLIIKNNPNGIVDKLGKDKVKELISYLKKMTAFNPKDRPSIQEVLKFIKEIGPISTVKEQPNVNQHSLDAVHDLEHVLRSTYHPKKSFAEVHPHPELQSETEEDDDKILIPQIETSPFHLIDEIIAPRIQKYQKTLQKRMQDKDTPLDTKIILEKRNNAITNFLTTIAKKQNSVKSYRDIQASILTVLEDKNLYQHSGRKQGETTIIKLFKIYSQTELTRTLYNHITSHDKMAENKVKSDKLLKSIEALIVYRDDLATRLTLQKDSQGHSVLYARYTLLNNFLNQIAHLKPEEIAQETQAILNVKQLKEHSGYHLGETSILKILKQFKNTYDDYIKEKTMENKSRQTIKLNTKNTDVQEDEVESEGEGKDEGEDEGEGVKTGPH